MNLALISISGMSRFLIESRLRRGFRELSGKDTNPVLSVLIPTRNRARYAIHAIRNVLSICSSNLELVVHDNSDNSELERCLQMQPVDPRLVYRRETSRLDVNQNFAGALDVSSGQYICFIGDDDGVNPEIVDAALWARASGLDAVVTSRPAQYWWPDIRFRHYGDELGGTLDIREFSGRISFPSAEQEMIKCARTAGRSFADLPRAYYGIVTRECMEHVKKTAGMYFPGPSPDLSSAIAVADCVGRYCKLDYPLFIPGSSGGSTAGMGALKKHTGRLEDVPHLPQDLVREWSDIVPRFWSGSTVWGEDVVQALKRMGRNDILNEFDVAQLHALCAVFNPEYIRTTVESLYRALRVTNTGYVLGSAKFGLGYAFVWCLRLRAMILHFLRPYRHMEHITDVDNVQQAGDALQAYLRSTHRRFDEKIA